MKTLFVRLMLIFASGLLLPTQATSQESPVLWKKTFAVPEMNYIGHTLVATPSGIFVGGEAVDTSTKSKSFLWLWKLTGQGERIFESRIEIPVEAQVERTQQMVVSVVPTLSGDLYALVLSKSGSYFLTQLDQTGKEIAKLPIVFSERGIRLTKMIGLDNEDFVLTGYSNNEAFVAVANRHGKVTRVKIQPSVNLAMYGKRARSIYVDAAVSDAGQILLLRNTGIPEQFYMGKGELALESFAMTGEPKGGSISIPGRDGSIQLGAKGLLTILYDKADDQGKDIWLRKLNKSSILLWEISILKDSQNLGAFAAVLLENEGYIVAGTDYLNTLELAYINEAGKETYRYRPDRKTEASWRVLALARESRNVYLMTSIFAEGKASIPAVGVCIQKLKNDVR